MFGISVMKKEKNIQLHFFSLLWFLRNYGLYSIYLPFLYEPKLFLISKSIIPSSVAF